MLETVGCLPWCLLYRLFFLRGQTWNVCGITNQHVWSGRCTCKNHLSLISYSFLITVPRDKISVERMNVADFRITTSAIASLDNYLSAISFGLKGIVELLLFLRMRSSRWIPAVSYLSSGRFLSSRSTDIVHGLLSSVVYWIQSPAWQFSYFWSTNLLSNLVVDVYIVEL